jgi:predicted nucleic acid-binding protein
MKPTVYLDATIPSYLLDPGTDDPILVGRHLVTRQWWSIRSRYELFVSQVVIDECHAGRPERASGRPELLKDLPLLDPTEEISEAAKFYAKNFAMPHKNLRDALHLAFASFYGIEYLVTWNLAHLANAHKRRHIQALNTILGYVTPTICTPEGLLEWASEE